MKGQQFDNWRVVGTVFQAARVQSRRDVDEIMLLDVNASREGRCIDSSLVESIASFVRVPLTVGGGISSISDVESLLRSGADRVCLGFKGVQSLTLLEDLSRVFGSQAILCSVDLNAQGNLLRYHGTDTWHEVDILDHMKSLAEAGAGELLLQRPEIDGTLSGLDTNLLGRLTGVSPLPTIFSSGLSSPTNAVEAAALGASAIAGGAIFQFTEHTPNDIKIALKSSGYQVRESVDSNSFF